MDLMKSRLNAQLKRRLQSVTRRIIKYKVYKENKWPFPCCHRSHRTNQSIEFLRYRPLFINQLPSGWLFVFIRRRTVSSVELDRGISFDVSLCNAFNRVPRQPPMPAKQSRPRKGSSVSEIDTFLMGAAGRNGAMESSKREKGREIGPGTTVVSPFRVEFLRTARVFCDYRGTW